MSRSLSICAAVAMACNGADVVEEPAAVTFYEDVVPILQTHCAACHDEGGIGPMRLETYEDLQAWGAAAVDSVQTGSMPPWPAGEDCNTYKYTRRLPAEDVATLEAWLDGGQAEGDPASAPEPPEDLASWTPDLTLPLPEPYTPSGLDDYRCQLVEWPLETPGYVTAMRVDPDQRALVHHTILYAANAAGAARYRALDEAEEGPGWTCFGGPDGGDMEAYISDLSLSEGIDVVQGLFDGDVSSDLELPYGVLFGADGGRWMGEWVPGILDTRLPPGTGLRMEPGDVLMVQMHYNTLSAEPVPDQSTLSFQVAEEVDRPATIVPLIDLGWLTNLEMFGGSMLLPAGWADVSHETVMSANELTFAAARRRLDVPEGEPLVAHYIGHHMHQLGKSAELSVVRASGEEECLLTLPDWDFDWQGGYAFEEPVLLHPEDSVRVRCSWDNSAANQLVVDGTPLEPRDVRWGDGTTDEMCLGLSYVTGP